MARDELVFDLGFEMEMEGKFTMSFALGRIVCSKEDWDCVSIEKRMYVEKVLRRLSREILTGRLGMLTLRKFGYCSTWGYTGWSWARSRGEGRGL